MNERGHHAIFARRVFSGTAMLPDCFVCIEDGRIAALQRNEPAGMPVRRLADDVVLSPGFVDAQVNGGGGVLFNDALDAAGLARIYAAHLRFGTTSLLPTVISGSREQLRTAMRVAGASDLPGIVGLHLEGPFLNPARRGIHPAAAMLRMSDADLDLLCEEFPGRLAVTLAPESVAPGAITRLEAAGRIVFAGHTDAGFAKVRAALDQGLAGFTHLFNAMSPLTAREPGAVGAALADSRAFAGIILDELHVHPVTAKLALAAMGPARLFLVSDAMATVGSDATEFQFAGQRIRLAQGRLTDDAGTLAGAHLTMAGAVRNAVRLLGCRLGDALAMATSTPAACLKLGHAIGHIAPGRAADLVALDADLCPVAVWAQGRPSIRFGRFDGPV